MSELDARFGKTRCTAMVKPNPLKGDADRNPAARNCGYPEFKDGFCKKHHPGEIAAREEEQAERQKAHENSKAILLLVKNGYRVELVTA